MIIFIGAKEGHVAWISKGAGVWHTPASASPPWSRPAPAGGGRGRWKALVHQSLAWRLGWGCGGVTLVLSWALAGIDVTSHRGIFAADGSLVLRELPLIPEPSPLYANSRPVLRQPRGAAPHSKPLSHFQSSPLLCPKITALRSDTAGSKDRRTPCPGVRSRVLLTVSSPSPSHLEGPVTCDLMTEFLSAPIFQP